MMHHVNITSRLATGQITDRMIHHCMHLVMSSQNIWCMMWSVLCSGWTSCHPSHDHIQNASSRKKFQNVKVCCLIGSSWLNSKEIPIHQKQYSGNTYNSLCIPLGRESIKTLIFTKLQFHPNQNHISYYYLIRANLNLGFWAVLLYHSTLSHRVLLYHMIVKLLQTYFFDFNDYWNPP